MAIIKKVGNQLTIKIPSDESRAFRHKDSVFQRHWYQLELQENGLGNIYSNISEGKDLDLVEVRDQLNTLNEKQWLTRMNHLLGGFVSNMYLVQKGKIYEPYIHPSNFVYHAAQERVVTFFRYDEALRAVDQIFLGDVYKIIAFLLTDCDIQQYDGLSMADMEVVMNDEQYKLFRDLLKQGNLENLIHYFLTDGEVERLKGYDSIVVGGLPATIKEVQYYANWVSKRPKPKQDSVYKESEDELIPKRPRPKARPNIDTKKTKQMPPKRQPKEKESNQWDEGDTVDDLDDLLVTAPVDTKKLTRKQRKKRDAEAERLIRQYEQPSNKPVVREPDLYRARNRKAQSRKRLTKLLTVVLVVIVAGIVYASM